MCVDGWRKKNYVIGRLNNSLGKIARCLLIGQRTVPPTTTATNNNNFNNNTGPTTFRSNSRSSTNLINSESLNAEKKKHVADFYK